MSPRRPVALSCGEPAGIGPELAVKAWQSLGTDCPFVWIGDPRHLPAGTPVAELDDLAETVIACARALPVLRLDFAAPTSPGQTDPANARGTIAAIEKAVELVQQGHASAVCTAPIHKKALIDGAGFAYPGHTEFLAALAGVERVVMMLASERLRVVPTTIHMALSEVPRRLTPDLLRETIEITAHDLRTRFGIAHPRLAVAGLNPHAGEGGAMGREEIDWITPLLAELPQTDFTVTGPHPADTMFHAAARARYDAAIAMYHDQALIPIKTLDFDQGVNVTLGLPFVRTSPDHGTAFDIAGKGIANPASLIAALRLAQKMGAQT
ncbi:4-hydroxythreonine-4-phosphate dehydrogenase PdxA [Pseudodonghicola xiamenensis]|uniref:4-hydroxythreonine-4-phosphate dehydrogenase n=1 Tax=Pseudodonghicola xiamenensis TaxID=337702 RepID=A0A8J3MBH7_9RHOB|nr:4-hydroxythreonine-4-phosphate dehydrogenase PdxA [Pseudodonghicola xiamenensis]GHG80241.1 4-hydroxythreonine-4-phosphate dehydrogenase [Pseudodonghicola xiamenensis]